MRGLRGSDAKDFYEARLSNDVERCMSFFTSHSTFRLAGSAVACSVRVPAVEDGDIIFRTSLSSQSVAIQRATHTKFSHSEGSVDPAVRHSHTGTPIGQRSHP
jgi:hypothetical protein